MIDFDAIKTVRKYGDILTEQQKQLLERRAFVNATEAELKKLEIVIEMFQKIAALDNKEENRYGMDF